MKLPNLESAIISEQKITEYLLSATHPIGKSKAGFFTRFGYRRERWQELGDALRRHANENPVTKIEESPFGQRYVIDGPLQAPDGRSPKVRAAWFIETGSNVPHLVTAYPSPLKGDQR